MSLSTGRKILKLRPVHKTEEELEDERKLIFQLPRKKCEQIAPALLGLGKLKKSDLQHKLHIFKRIMKNARIKHVDKRLQNIAEFDASEKVIPHGEVSKRIYNEIFHSRDFDLYGRKMPPTTGLRPRKHLELKVLASQLDIEFTQKIDDEYKAVEVDSLDGGGSFDDETIEESVGGDIRPAKLITHKWKIGKVEKVNPPVGLSANPAEAYHSLGNEMFYSYDGHWKAGKMHGQGKYLFTDTETYEGTWEDGRQNGKGVARYPGGQKYDGCWENGRYGGGSGEATYLGGTKYKGGYSFGRRSGNGTLTYPSGLTYCGDFYDGKPHGRGLMTSALTGWSYEGTFVGGYICGSGSLYTPPPEKKQIVYYWSENKEKVTLPGLVRHYLEQQDGELLARERKRHEMYAPLRGAQLNAYVTQIRTALYAERLMQKREQYHENVVKAREQKAKLYQARLDALAGED